MFALLSSIKKKKREQTKDIKESFIVKIGRAYNFTFFQVYKNSQSRNFFSLSSQQTNYLNWERESSFPAKLRQRWWHLDILASLQLLFTIHQVIDSIDDYLNKFNL